MLNDFVNFYCSDASFETHLTITHAGYLPPPMNPSVSVIVVVALVLSACASSTRTETTSQPTAQAPVTPAPAAQSHPVPAPTPAPEASNLRPREVTVEEIARVKKSGSSALHSHDHKKFNRAAYLADPAAYLGQIAGSRIYDVANPAADLAALAPVGPTGLSVATNTEATLAARTEPGMPVTFTSFGLGQFPASGLQTVTVAADEQGVARAQFRVTPGTVGSCLITAGSPVVSSNIQFLISIPESKP